jgi:hypothetical protein
MKQLFFIQFMVCVALASAQAPPSSKMHSTTTPSSQIEGIKPYEKQNVKPQPQAVLPPPVKPAPAVPQHAEYLHPGILVFINGAWQGSDHLLNLPKNIGVYVKIIKPEEESLNTSDKDLQKQVERAFAEANIKPLTMAVAGKPPLPAFEIEIFVYPIERGYAAFLDGRLFESVILDRFKMDPNMAFQAITWEKQTLIVSPKEQFAEHIVKAVEEITGAFITRYQAYEHLKNTATY